MFAYDVIAAILNNLHILKNTKGFTSGARWIWNQHLDIDKKASNKLVYVKNKGDVFVYDIMAAILNNLHILRNTQGFTSGTRRIWIQHLDIDKKPSNKFVLCQKTREMCLSMTSWRPF